MAEHRRLLVVDEHFLRDAAEGDEAANETVAGMLGVLVGGDPGVKAAGVGELVDNDVDGRGLASDGGCDLPPVTLELLVRVGLEADGRTARAQDTPGSDGVAQDGDAAVVTLAFERAEDDNGIPNAVRRRSMIGLKRSSVLPRGVRLRAGAASRLRVRLTVLGWTPSSAAMFF